MVEIQESQNEQRFVDSMLDRTLKRTSHLSLAGFAPWGKGFSHFTHIRFAFRPVFSYMVMVMMNLFTRSRLFSFVWISIVLWVTSNASGATTDIWTNNANGLWSTDLNWSSNQAPNFTFNLILITNANSKTVTVDAATPSTNLTIQSLTLSAPPGSTNTLALVDLTTNVPLQMSAALTVGQGGLLILTNAALTSAGVRIDHGGAINLTNSVLKETGFGFFDVVNGSALLDSGLIDCGANQAVRLGRTNNSAGNLILNGGSMITSDFQLGTLTGSRGMFFAPVAEYKRLLRKIVVREISRFLHVPSECVDTSMSPDWIIKENLLPLFVTGFQPCLNKKLGHTLDLIFFQAS